MFLTFTLQLHARIHVFLHSQSKALHLPSPPKLLVSIVASCWSPLPYMLFSVSQLIHLWVTLCTQAHCLPSVPKKDNLVDIRVLRLLLTCSNVILLQTHWTDASCSHPFHNTLPNFHKYQSSTNSSYHVTPKLRCTSTAGICLSTHSTPLSSVHQYLLHQKAALHAWAFLAWMLWVFYNEVACIWNICTSYNVRLSVLFDWELLLQLLQIATTQGRNTGW